MQIEFDPDKNATNQKKHGLSLAEAEYMDLGNAAIDPDRRYAYGEDRFQALGQINGRMHLLVFTVRGDVLRVISLRKANPKEVKRYDERA